MVHLSQIDINVIYLPVCLWIMGPHSRAPKKNTSQWKWGATARYYASHTKTIFTNEEIRAKIQQAIRSHKDHLTLKRDADCSVLVMSPVHQIWPKPSCKAQWKGEEDKADRGGGGKTTLGNGQAWSSPSPRGQWRRGKNGGNWLQNHVVPHWPLRLRDRWDEREMRYESYC